MANEFEYPIYAIVLLHMDDMAIAESPDGTLVWANIPEEYAQPGQAVELEFMRDLQILPPDQQQRIRAARAAMPADLLAVLIGGDNLAEDGV